MSEQIPGGAEGPNKWRVIGISRDQWKLLARRARRSAATSASGSRTTSTCPNGEMARSNGDLIAKARQMAEDVGRRAATVAEARELLGVPQARARRRRERPRPLDGRPASSTSPGCCRAASARCCSPTSAPTCSRSRTPAWATTSAGRRPTTAARSSSALGTRSALFLALNRNKRSIRARPQARARAARCCCGSSRDYDVLLESFRPGVLDRLGVGYERAARGATRRSSTARSPATARTARYRDALGPRHELPRRSIGLLGPDRRARTARRSSRPARSPTSAAAR